ncbi:hypothetical protein O6H91_05G030500 [Diphasiastrum complanatum]|uniref:Uncharacterized protein n=1 Tax=Diphasiastrum complanatum TaxID=34168 RepID=A0ACC2DM53_DIPCM|nr:hypothetical protein O6H91_05G030500 [Diphasiastrum complanatum]
MLSPSEVALMCVGTRLLPSPVHAPPTSFSCAIPSTGQPLPFVTLLVSLCSYRGTLPFFFYWFFFASTIAICFLLPYSDAAPFSSEFSCLPSLALHWVLSCFCGANLL